MILSRSCEHAVRAILHLAGRPAGTYVFTKDIAQQEGIPFYFLGKIFQNLAKDGLLLSIKGRRGGFALARPASKITLLEVVKAVDGLEGFEQCVVGLPLCGGEHPCPLHERWALIRTAVYDMLSSKTITELLREG